MDIDAAERWMELYAIERWMELYAIYDGLDQATQKKVARDYHDVPLNRNDSMEYALTKHGISIYPVAKPEPMDDTEYNDILLSQDIHDALQGR